MERLKSGNTPLLNSHRSDNLDDVLGVIEKASVSKGEGRATVRFSKEERVDSIFRDVVDQIISLRQEDPVDAQNNPNLACVAWPLTMAAERNGPDKMHQRLGEGRNAAARVGPVRNW